MSYDRNVLVRISLIWCSLACFFMVIHRSRADEVEMQNGDRYCGKVLSVSSDTVIMDSEMLGKIKVPRKLMTDLFLGTNVAPPTFAGALLPNSEPTNFSASAKTVSSSNLAPTNVDLSAALRQLGANTNFVGQIRDQMLAGSPEAAGKYNQMVSGLMSGNLNLNDLRLQAKASADQIRALKQQLRPDADDSLDAYLQVLDNFIKETDGVAAENSMTSPPKTSNP
jgi:hypothetical protein